MRRKNVKNNKTKYNLNHKIHEKYYIFIVILYRRQSFDIMLKKRFDWKYTDGCFPCGLAGKEYAYFLYQNMNAGGRPAFSLWVGKILWRKERLPTPIFLSKKSHEVHGFAKSRTWLTDFHTDGWLETFSLAL